MLAIGAKKMIMDQEQDRRTNALMKLKDRCPVCKKKTCNGMGKGCFSGCYICGCTDHDKTLCDAIQQVGKVKPRGYCPICFEPGRGHGNHIHCPVQSRIKLLMVRTFVEPDDPNDRPEYYAAHLNKLMQDKQSYDQFLVSSFEEAWQLGSLH